MKTEEVFFEAPNSPFRWFVGGFLADDDPMGDLARDTLRDQYIWEINDLAPMRRYMSRRMPYPLSIQFRRAFNKAVREGKLIDGHLNLSAAPIKPKLRFKVMKRDGYRCQLCGRNATEDKTTRLEIDHKHPVSKGGTSDETNLWLLCFECNRGKRDRFL